MSTIVPRILLIIRSRYLHGIYEYTYAGFAARIQWVLTWVCLVDQQLLTARCLRIIWGPHTFFLAQKVWLKDYMTVAQTLSNSMTTSRVHTFPVVSYMYLITSKDGWIEQLTAFKVIKDSRETQLRYITTIINWQASGLIST